MPVDQTSRAPGESIAAFDAALLADPYPMYRRWRQEGSLHPGEPGQWFVLAYPDVSRLLAEPGCPHWDDRPSEGHDFIGAVVRRYHPESPPEYRQRARRAIRQRYRSAEPELTEIARRHAASLPRAGAIELMADFVRPFMFEVSCVTIGVPEEVRPRLYMAMEHYSQPIPNLIPAARGAREGGLIGRCVVAAIAQTLEHAGKRRDNDLASVAWDAWETGERPRGATELDQLLFTLYASMETGAGFIGNAVHALLVNPGEMAKARSGIDSSRVHELLRFNGPIQFISTATREAQLVDGHEIPPGDRVFLCVAAANRDPELCDDPETLDLDRGFTRHLAFGRGPLRCVGANLGELQVRVALHELLAARPALGLVADDPVEWKREARMMRGPSRLPLTVN